MGDDVKVIELADGRDIAYGETGEPDGIPIVMIHGIPGGTRFPGFDPDAVAAAGARVFTPARPGFAASTRQPGRTLLDYGRDIGEFADQLGLDRFAIVGVSAGGPSTMATGSVLGDRLGCVGVACAIGPVFDNPQFDPLLSDELQFALPLARADRDAVLPLIRDLMAPLCTAAADAEAYFDGPYIDGVPEVDKAGYLGVRDAFVQCIRDTYGNGPDPLVDEINATFGPWEFDLATITAPVRGWHGDADPGPSDPMQHAVSQVPDGRFTIYPGEGHVMSPSHHPDWLATLTAWAR